jgi:hypothetical protein
MRKQDRIAIKRRLLLRLENAGHAVCAELATAAVIDTYAMPRL